ncbi:hypothetical protein [Streptomyces sp. NPDC046197]|uniref:hypothetical protein n=1 Tax=Streptomyces sp. NPDC046197 TaxID=3154337 RepID=UPI0033E0B5B7
MRLSVIGTGYLGATHAARSWVCRPRIVDGRGVLDPDRWTAAGWQFRALGRSAPAAEG